METEIAQAEEVEEPTVPDLGDKKTVEKRKTKLELRSIQQNEDLRAILATPGGRRFLWRLLEQTGMYVSSYQGEERALPAIYREGMRSLGLWSIGEISSADPGAYALMRSEAVTQEKING